MEVLHVVLASLFSAVILFLIAKIIGHKQVAQLEFFDYITGITIGSIAAELATTLDKPWWKPTISMLVFDPSRSILKPQLLVNGFEATKNLLTISKKRCPHLGCALKWNSVEHSWDCPCHGSRFDKFGKVLDNPSNGNLKK